MDIEASWADSALLQQWFSKFGFSMETLSSNEIADAILGNQRIWDALIDGGCYICTPTRFLLMLSAAGLEAS